MRTPALPLRHTGWTARATRAPCRGERRSTSSTTRSRRPVPRRSQNPVCLALVVRTQERIGTPVSDDERNDTSEEGVDKAAIDRLAASIRILPATGRYAH